jgi:hypothetical protein
MQAIPHTPTVCCIHPQHHNGHIRCLGSASRLLDVRLPRTFTHTPRHCTARDSSREHTPRPNTTHQHTTHTMTTRQRLPERGAMAPRLETAPSLRRTPTTHTRVAHSTTTCIDNWPSRSQPLRTHTHSTPHRVHPTRTAASSILILSPHPQCSILNPKYHHRRPPSLPATARAAHALGAPQYPGHGGWVARRAALASPGPAVVLYLLLTSPLAPSAPHHACTPRWPAECGLCTAYAERGFA